MTSRKAIADKVMVIGIDGMDPSLTKKFLDMGKLPNIKKLVEEGTARENLKMMGNVPTITPPMWTTMATGATPSVHGITCFWRQSEDALDAIGYNLDSRLCYAEQIWNVLSEANIKTLVFNWPGSSWPPTSDNPNLHVVDGSNPGSVTSGIATIDPEQIVVADETIIEVGFKPSAPVETGAGCIIKNLEEDKQEDNTVDTDCKESALHIDKVVNIVLKHADGELALETMGKDLVNSPIKEPSGWKNIPPKAKEFSFYFNGGLIRRPALLCCNNNGEYDRVLVYRNKNDIEPLCTIMSNQPAYEVMDQYQIDGQELSVYRSFYIIDLDPAGRHIRLFVTDAYKAGKDSVFHPTRLYKNIVENVGYPPAFVSGGGKDPEFIRKGMILVWEHLGKWQADAIKYLIKTEGYRAVFSHFHNMDSYGHTFYFWAKQKERFNIPEAVYQDLMEKACIDADNYIGHYLPLLDEGWTLLLVSDHGLMIGDSENYPYLGDPFGVNVRVMMDLGYTILKKDDKGNLLKEIDWTKTSAVASRGNHIWINLKGRNETGIIDKEDKYELEERIINDLYSYRYEGKRVISIALRNKDAALIGFSGPETGDIVYFLNEGLNRVHGDSLPTFEGYFDTSVSPIFVAAGKGIKKDCVCERIIRQIDIAPTISALMGVRMPAQCEGAPAYQIFSDEF